MSTPLIRRPESDGASLQAVPDGMSGPAEYGLPATVSGLGAELSAVLVLLTGVWVALSPWFLTLQSTGNNATIVNLISGIAVAGAGAFALASPARVRRPGDRRRAARRLADHRRADPEPEAPDRRRHVLVQQLGRRPPDRRGRSRTGRGRSAPTRPPLSAPGMRARVVSPVA